MADLPPADWHEQYARERPFPTRDAPLVGGKSLMEMIDISEMRVAEEGEEEIFEIIWRDGVGYAPRSLDAEVIHGVLRSYVETHAEIPNPGMLRRETKLWGVKAEYIESQVQQIVADIAAEQKTVIRAALLGELMIEAAAQEANEILVSFYESKAKEADARRMAEQEERKRRVAQAEADVEGLLVAATRDANRIKREIKEADRQVSEPVEQEVESIVPVIRPGKSVISKTVQPLTQEGMTTTPLNGEKADPQRDRVLRAVGPWLATSDGRIRAKVLIQRMADGFSLHPGKAQEYLDYACKVGLIFKRNMKGTPYYLNYKPDEKPELAPTPANHEHRGEICARSEIASAILSVLARPDTSLATDYPVKTMQAALYRDYIDRRKHAPTNEVKEVMKVLIAQGVMDRRTWEGRHRSKYGSAASAGQFMAGLASSEVKMQLLKDPAFRDQIIQSFQNPESNTDD